MSKKHKVEPVPVCLLFTIISEKFYGTLSTLSLCAPQSSHNFSEKIFNNSRGFPVMNFSCAEEDVRRPWKTSK